MVLECAFGVFDRPLSCKRPVLENTIIDHSLSLKIPTPTILAKNLAPAEYHHAGHTLYSKRPAQIIPAGEVVRGGLYMLTLGSNPKGSNSGVVAYVLLFLR